MPPFLKGIIWPNKYTRSQPFLEQHSSQGDQLSVKTREVSLVTCDVNYFRCQGKWHILQGSDSPVIEVPIYWYMAITFFVDITWQSTTTVWSDVLFQQSEQLIWNKREIDSMGTELPHHISYRIQGFHNNLIMYYNMLWILILYNISYLSNLPFRANLLSSTDAYTIQT